MAATIAATMTATMAATMAVMQLRRCLPLVLEDHHEGGQPFPRHGHLE
jgi:hypothetical protein